MSAVAAPLGSRYRRREPGLETLRFQVLPTSLPALTMEGRLFTPREALQLGLVHELAPETDLLETALRRAAGLAAPPPAGVRQVKADLRRAAARAARDSSAEQTEQWLDSWFDPGAQERLRAAVARLRT